MNEIKREEQKSFINFLCMVTLLDQWCASSLGKEMILHFFKVKIRDHDTKPQKVTRPGFVIVNRHFYAGRGIW